MSGETTIPYLTKVWNVTPGCTPISEGCQRCWARSMAKRFDGGDFTPRFRPELLRLPATWKKPQVVGVSFTGDLFHVDHTPTQINLVLSKMREVRHHKYLILTKRAYRMYLMQWRESYANVYWGVTVENQKAIKDRWPYLSDCNGSRWVSFEPLLGDIRLPYSMKNRVHYAVIGCESGPGARPCPIEWVDDLVKQLKDYNVPTFVKQIRRGSKMVKCPKGYPQDRIRP